MNTLSVFSLFAAWAAGVPVRICHNHSTAGRGETKKNIMKYLLRPFAKVFATDYCACSRYAGEWLFGKRAVRENKVTIFNNAIDLERFRFNPSIRESVRRELGLEGKFVIGHVGRFCIQKNHDFLIDVFAEVYRQRNDAVLVLVGNGELFDEVKAKVHRLGLDNAVVFLGVRGDVDRLYQAMDVFVLPSRYEGLGIVNIEAQTAGLPCVVSDVVPLEAKMTDQIIFLPLYKNADKWAEWICKYGISDVRSRGREWRETRFDIASEGKNLQYFYAKRTEQYEKNQSFAS